jgi:hypothetical protein
MSSRIRPERPSFSAEGSDGFLRRIPLSSSVCLSQSLSESPDAYPSQAGALWERVEKRRSTTASVRTLRQSPDALRQSATEASEGEVLRRIRLG